MGQGHSKKNLRSIRWNITWTLEMNLKFLVVLVDVEEVKICNIISKVQVIFHHIDLDE